MSLLACVLLSTACSVVKFVPKADSDVSVDQTDAEVLGEQHRELSAASTPVANADTEQVPTEPGLLLTPNPYEQSQTNVPRAAKTLFVDAVTDMRNQRWQEAELLLQQLTVEYPRLSGPFLNLGLVYRNTDRMEQAEQAFIQAVEANDKNLDAYNQLGLLKREQGAFDEAEAYYLKALDVWPQHAPSHRNLGILYDLYLGQFYKALEHYEDYRALQEAPDKQLLGWIVDLKRRLQELAKAPAQ